MDINRKPIHTPDIRKWVRLLAFSILVAVSGQLRAAAEVSDPERISVAYCTDCVPFHFRDAQGQPAGMIVELWRLWSEKTGVAIDFQPASWSDSLQRVRDGRSQVHAGLFFNEQRDRYLDYGAVLANTDTHVFLHHTLPLIERVEDLAGYRTGVLAGDYVEDHLKQHLPDDAVISYRDYDAMLKDLRAGKLRAFAADTPTGIVHLKREGLLKQFKISDNHLLYSNDWRLAVGQGDAELLEMLNQGMAQVSAEERTAIAKRWTDSEAIADKALITARPQSLNRTPGQAIEEERNKITQMFSAGQLAAWFAALAAVLVILLAILRRLRGEIANRIFERRNLSYIVLALVTAFLAVVLLVAWFALERMDRQLRAELADTLVTVNQSVKESLNMWLENRSREIQHLAHDRELLPLAQQLLALPRDADAIRDSQVLERMRALYRYHMDEMNAKGFFLIAPDRISIGSMRDANIGTRNLIADQQLELMNRAFSGETVFIPPIYSDVPLKDASGRMVERAATMFFATPLHDPSGAVIAVLTLRFDPASEFRRMTHVGQMGVSGETYAFDRQARLLTESRLDHQLAELSQYFPAGSRLLSMHISDPGGNLLQGFQPASERAQWPLTRMAKEALNERDGLDISGYRDYRGVPVIGTWSWLDRLGIGLATEIDLSEALMPYHAMRTLVLGALGGVAFVALLLTVLTVWLGERARGRLRLLVNERTEELRKVVQAVEQSPLCVVITDMAGNIEHVNPTFTRVTGYEADEVIGKNPRVLKSGDTPPDRYESLWETILAGKVWHSEIRNRKKNGELYWGSISIAPVKNAAGEVTHFVAMTADITKAKEVELALQESEYTRNLALDAAQVGLWTYVIETDSWAWDDRVNRMMGFPEGMERDIQRWVEILHPDDRDFVLEELQATTRGERLFDVEYRVIWPDGTVRYIAARGKTTFDDDGKPLRIDGITYDVTDLRATQAAMLEAQELNKLILDSAGEGIFGLDTQGRTRFVNAAALRMLGYQLDELLGHSIHTMVHHSHEDGSDYPEQNCQMRAAYTRGETVTEAGEVLWCKDSSFFPVEYTATPMIVGEKSTGAVITFRDITERKRSEDALRSAKLAAEEATQALFEAKEAAEEATRAKSDFLANMSHEIRTPMNAIIGLSHLALRTGLSRKQRDYLDKISASANNLLGIINDILDFSKIEAGKLDMETIDFDLIEVLDNFSNVVAVKSSEKGLELIVDLADDVPMGLKGDPLRLNQILINLANNAIKFTEQGEIAVRIEVLQRDAEAVQLRFAVRDTGIGMTEAQRGKLFQAFSQADTSTSRKFGGTGLGLTISKRLVEMMDGEIGVDSQPGVGSEFHFTARFGIGAAPRQSGPRALPDDLRDLRVLVVDDNPTSRTILARYLESFGFRCSEAASGEQALAELETADPPYKMVLMDWKMPGMDGIETTRRMRADEKLATMPKVLMVSAYGREELHESAEEVGIQNYLVKPVNPSTLLDATLEAFGHEVEQGLHQDHGARAADHLRGAHLLLVEDNEINQQVATELLEQAGLEVTIANHGREGVDLLSAQQDSFDGVLMDIQMPIMDGYSATREIRKDARFKHLPIIAMTANAMAQDRQQALDAGMNDHVAKPINVKELFEVLGKWIEVPEERRTEAGLPAREPDADSLPRESTAAMEVPKLEGIDTAGGLKRVGGNSVLYLKILRKFRDSQADTVERIRAATEVGDTDTAEREAHTLKGLAGNIGAQALYQVAERVEQLFRKGEPGDSIETPLAELQTELSTVMAALNQLGEGGATPASGEASGDAPDITRVPVLLAQLRELLEDDDADAEQPVEALIPLLAGSPQASVLTELADHVDNYDFDAALDAMTRLEAEIPGGG